MCTTADFTALNMTAVWRYVQFQKGALNLQGRENIPRNRRLIELTPVANGCRRAKSRITMSLFCPGPALWMGMLEFIKMKNPKLAIVWTSGKKD